MVSKVAGPPGSATSNIQQQEIKPCHSDEQQSKIFNMNGNNTSLSFMLFILYVYIYIF